MKTTIAYLRSNAIGLAALFVALGGTGYAAIGIPRGSVGTPQLHNHAVTPIKLGKGITGSVRAWAIVTPTGKVLAGGGKPSVVLPPTPDGQYTIYWGVPIPKVCATVATIDPRGALAPTETVPTPGGGQANVVAGYVSNATVGGTARSRATTPTTGLSTFNQAGQLTALPFDVTVIC